MLIENWTEHTRTSKLRHRYMTPLQLISFARDMGWSSAKDVSIGLGLSYYQATNMMRGDLAIPKHVALAVKAIRAGIVL